MVPLKGYFLVISGAEVAVFNTSIHIRGGVKEVFRDHPGAIGYSFGHWLGAGTVPSASASRMSRLLVGLDKGSVAVFHTALPQPFVQAWSGSTMWRQPLFVAFMVLIGVWQFNQAKAGGGFFGGRRRGGGGRGGKFDFGDDPQVRETIRQFQMSQARGPSGGGSLAARTAGMARPGYGAAGGGGGGGGLGGGDMMRGRGGVYGRY